MTDAQVQTWLTSKIVSGAFPRPDSNTIYVIFYPKESVITNDAGTSCHGYNAYHSNYMRNGLASPLSYVDVGRWPPPLHSATAIDLVSGEASHEIIEVGTGTWPATRPAYGQVVPVVVSAGFLGRGGV